MKYIDTKSRITNSFKEKKRRTSDAMARCLLSPAGLGSKPGEAEIKIISVGDEFESNREARNKKKISSPDSQEPSTAITDTPVKSDSFMSPTLSTPESMFFLSQMDGHKEVTWDYGASPKSAHEAIEQGKKDGKGTTISDLLTCIADGRQVQPCQTQTSPFSKMLKLATTNDQSPSTKSPRRKFKQPKKTYKFQKKKGIPTKLKTAFDAIMQDSSSALQVDIASCVVAQPSETCQQVDSISRSVESQLEDMEDDKLLSQLPLDEGDGECGKQPSVANGDPKALFLFGTASDSDATMGTTLVAGETQPRELEDMWDDESVDELLSTIPEETLVSGTICTNNQESKKPENCSVSSSTLNQVRRSPRLRDKQCLSNSYPQQNKGDKPMQQERRNSFTDSATGSQPCSAEEIARKREEARKRRARVMARRQHSLK